MPVYGMVGFLNHNFLVSITKMLHFILGKEYPHDGIITYKRRGDQFMKIVEGRGGHMLT